MHRMMITIMPDYLPWNGTHLGSYTEDIIKSHVESEPYDMFLVEIPKYDDGAIWCTMQKSKSLYPCIVDEIKYVLTLTKIGTHSLYIGGKLHILYNIRNPTLLTKYEMHPSLSEVLFKQAIQDVYVFKMIVGCGHMYDKSILVMGNIPTAYQITISCDNMDIDNIPKRVFDVWFIDQACNTVGRMMRRYKRTEIIRDNLQRVINSIDKSFIWLENLIIQKLMKIG